jgi:hypothetical protein
MVHLITESRTSRALLSRARASSRVALLRLHPYSHLAEDGLKDNNPETTDPGDSGACYFLAKSFALPKAELACHSL